MNASELDEQLHAACEAYFVAIRDAARLYPDNPEKAAFTAEPAAVSLNNAAMLWHGGPHTETGDAQQTSPFALKAELQTAQQDLYVANAAIQLLKMSEKDNHHNSAGCPYCQQGNERTIERLTAELVALKAEQTKAHELLHDVYDAHRDPQSHESDWNYADKKPVEDAPCAWCDDVKALFDSNPVALKAERAWQPIETAPKDEPVVVLDGTHGPRVIVAMMNDYLTWLSVPGGYSIYPTHWMPLPPPPASSERERK